MRHYLLLLLIACQLVACEVVSTKNVKLPYSPEKLVVNGIISNLGVGIYVTKTVPVLQSNPTSFLLEAIVSLQKDGKPVSILQRGSNLYITDSSWKYDKNIIVMVEHASLGKVSAVPESLPNEVKINEISAVYNKEQTEATLNITFRDLPGTDYYAYKIIAAKNGVSFANDNIYKIPPDALISDLSFENQIKKITTQLFLIKETNGNQIIRANQIKIYLYHLSIGTHDYYRSLHEYDSYNDDTFAEVLPVKNNIINGYGFLGVCSIDTVTISIK